MKILIYSVFFCFTASLKLLQHPLTSCLPSFRHSLPFAIIAEINRTLKCRIRLVSLRRQRHRYRLVQCRNFAIYLPKFSCGQIKWPECFKLQSFCFVLFISCLPLLTLPVLHHLVLPLCQLLEVWSNHKTLKGDAGARVSSTAFRLGSLAHRSPVARLPGRQVATMPGCQVAWSSSGRRHSKQVDGRSRGELSPITWAINEPKVVMRRRTRVASSCAECEHSLPQMYSGLKFTFSEGINTYLDKLITDLVDLCRVVSCIQTQL